MPRRLRADPIDSPPGVQPEADGKLQCLECGVWYRGLGQHVARKHGMDPDDYRRDHELPKTRALWPEDLRQQQADRVRSSLAADPAWRAAFRPSHTTQEERLAMAHAALRESVGRAGVRAVRQQAAAEGGRHRRAALEQKHARRAHELGYSSLAEMLTATSDLTGRGVGALLGVSAAVATTLRRRHGLASPGHQAVDRKQVTVRRRPDPVRTPLALRPAVPPGVQPEQNNRVQCLDCGRWYRALGNHLRLTHGVSVDEYQAEHQLPASRGLVPEDLREQMAERQRRRMAEDEQLRAVLATGAEQLRERAARAREVRARTKDRAGVRRAWEESGRQAARRRTAQTRARYDELARAAGYSDVMDLLQKTTDVTAAQLAVRLGMTKTQIVKLRARNGIRSTSKTAAAAERKRQREAALTPPQVPVGTQPRDADGRLQCLECGRWYPGLAHHVKGAHGMAAADYRRRHELLAAEPLTSAEVSQARSERFRDLLATDPRMLEAQARGGARLAAYRDKATAASRASAKRPEVRRMLQASVAHASQVRSQQRRERHDARARELGYRDLGHLLDDTAHLMQKQVATLLNVSGSQVGRLRAQAADST